MRLSKTRLRNGMVMWYRSDDRYVGQRIAAGKYEEFETEIILRQALRLASTRGGQAGVVVDVGANIGYYTLLLAGLCKKVYAIEPDKESWEILKKNVEANQLKNVVLLNMAASDRKEQRAMIKDKENLGNTRLGSNKLDGILCRGLDNILANEQKIDLIKIDVQGWEPQVIEGAKKLIKRDFPTMFLEYTPGEKSEKMMEFLREVYRNIWSIDYWFYIYRRGIHIERKTGYVDLWMKKEATINDLIGGYKNVQIKKVIKAIMGICQR